MYYREVGKVDKNVETRYKFLFKKKIGLKLLQTSIDTIIQYEIVIVKRSFHQGGICDSNQ